MVQTGWQIISVGAIDARSRLSIMLATLVAASWAHDDVQPQRRCAAVGDPDSKPAEEGDPEVSAVPFGSDGQAGLRQQLSVVRWFGEETGRWRRGPWHGIGHLGRPGSHDVVDAEDAVLGENAPDLGEQGLFARDVHPHMQHAGAIERMIVEGQRGRAALMEPHLPGEPAAAGERPGDLHVLLRQVDSGAPDLMILSEVARGAAQPTSHVEHPQARM
jgi:hypothetical protein